MRAIASIFITTILVLAVLSSRAPSAPGSATSEGDHAVARKTTADGPAQETPEEPTAAVDASELGRISPRSIPPAKESSTPENVISPSVPNAQGNDHEMVRRAAENYAAAVLAGRADRAVALADPSEDAESMAALGKLKMALVQFRNVSGVKPPDIRRILVSNGLALAVSQWGRPVGELPGGVEKIPHLVFVLTKQEGNWLVKGGDYGWGDEILEKIERFKQEHPGADEVIFYSPISLFLRIGTDTPVEQTLDMIWKLGGSGIHCLQVYVDEGQRANIENILERASIENRLERDGFDVEVKLLAGGDGQTQGTAAIIRVEQTVSHLELTRVIDHVLELGIKNVRLMHLTPVTSVLDQPQRSRQREDPSSVAAAREQYNELEQQAAQIAEQYGELSDEGKDETGDAETLKRKLSNIVSEAFDVRQKLQRAELTRLRQRLGRIEQQIAARQRIKDAIVDRRVERLLHPDVRWDPAHQADDVPSGLTGRSSEQHPATAATADGSQSPDAATLSSPAASQVDDRERLVGTWKYVDAQDGGRELPAEWRQKSGMVATNRELIFWKPVGWGNRFTYELNPSAAPREIDLTRQGGQAAGKLGQAAGKLYPGIYKFEGERLVICFKRDGGMRPAEFISLRRSPELDTVLMVLERIGPAQQLLKKHGRNPCRAPTALEATRLRP